MYRPFYFADILGERHSKDHDPESCPVCHYAVAPEEVAHSIAHERNEKKARLEIVFRCPRDACSALFIARYRAVSGQDNARGEFAEFRLVSCVPRTPEPPDIPERIGEISPGFGQVYAEALAAESYGLGQVAGAGLRKALEHLIKDYCIQKYPGSVADIKERPLANCIKQYVDEVRVAECAERAVWLGNDATHYLRKWVKHDISDLKVLIRLTLHWIESAELTEKYVAKMDRGGPS